MARSKKVNDEMREIRLEQIRLEALKQFSTKGLVETKVKDIATEINMSQGLIYHYYKSKEEIFLELIDDSLDKINEEMLNIKALEEKPHIKLEIAINRLLNTIESNEKASMKWKLILQATNTNLIFKDCNKEINKKVMIPHYEIAKIIREGQEIGTIVDGKPKELAVTFWSLIIGLLVYKSTYSENTIIPDYKMLTRMFIK